MNIQNILVVGSIRYLPTLWRIRRHPDWR